MAEFLGIGDLHLTDDSNSGGLSKYIEDHDAFVISECNKVLEYGRAKGVNRVFLYGDTSCNPRMSYSAMLKLASFWGANTDFTFEIILGNHDMYGTDYRAGHSLELLASLYKGKNVRFHLKPRLIELDGVPCKFLPFPSVDFDKKALNIFHNEVRGSKNDGGRVNDAPDLSESSAVCVAGHLHTNHRVRNTNYAGTLYQTNFGESLQKYFHHIEFNSHKDFDIQSVPHTPKYKLHTVVLQTRDDLREVPTSKYDLLKLVVQDGANIDASDLQQFKNIAVLKNFKTKEDLASVLVEDLSEGAAISLSTQEFFKTWIEGLDIEKQMRQRMIHVRRKILNAVGA